MDTSLSFLPSLQACPNKAGGILAHCPTTLFFHSPLRPGGVSKLRASHHSHKQDTGKLFRIWSTLWDWCTLLRIYAIVAIRRLNKSISGMLWLWLILSWMLHQEEFSFSFQPYICCCDLWHIIYVYIYVGRQILLEYSVYIVYMHACVWTKTEYHLWDFFLQIWD